MRSVKNTRLVETKHFAQMQVRGVPDGVLLGYYNSLWPRLLTRIEIDPNMGITKAVSADKQKKMYDDALENPFANPYLFCMAGQRSDHLPLQLALRLFLAAINKNPMGSRARPWWHTVTGHTKDELRDDADHLERIGQPSFLVVSNVASNSTMMKVEKVRDLMDRYRHIPRVLVVGGESPIHFCSRVLFMPVNRLVYFGIKETQG